MRMTTQQGLKSPVFNISINCRAYKMFQTKYLNSKFVKETLFSPNNLIRQKNTSNSTDISMCSMHHILEIKRKGYNIGDMLTNFILDYVVPNNLTFYGSSIQTGGKIKFNNLIRKHGIQHHCSKKRRANKQRIK